MTAALGYGVRVCAGKAWKFGLILLLGGLFVLPGCASRQPVYYPSQQRPVYRPATPQPAPSDSSRPVLQPVPKVREQEMAPPAVEPRVKTESANPQLVASMERVKQAERHLAARQPDAAIPLLEQGIQIDAYNGECYYHLARAWDMKNSPNRALEFARKAEMLLLGEPAKLKQVYVLEAGLLDKMGKQGEAEEYRRKAERLN